MARFVCRNYGPSRQVFYKGRPVCLSHDQVIETDDVEEASLLGKEKQITVVDRGEEFATPIPSEKDEKSKDKKKERTVTVDDAEEVHREKHPDENEQQQETGGTQPPESTKDKDEIAYPDMLVKELLVLAKDRQIKTSGLKKEELIQALEDYDKEE